LLKGYYTTLWSLDPPTFYTDLRHWSRDPDHTPFRDDLTSAGWDLLPLNYRPNLKFLTIPIMKI